jgi:hypothetical protein
MKKILLFVMVGLLAGGLCRAQIPVGTWSGALDIQGVSLTLVFNFSEDACTLDVPDQGAKGLKASASLTALGAVHVDVPSIGASFEGYRFGDKINGSFTQNGMSLPLTLKPGALERKRPQTPQPPFPYATEAVSFTNGDAVLKGTLTLPEGCTKDTPVLLMVTGSGLQDRDETLFEHKPFAVIADFLARRGIATLRYDDRGFGESTGDLMRVTTEDLKEDAAAGIALLRERFSNVGVIGHSEGGSIALMLAAEKKADFIVSLAGMAISGRETLLWQNREGLLQAGLDEKTVDVYCKALEDTFDAATDGLPLPSPGNYDLPAALKQNLQQVQAQLGLPYLRYFVKLDVSKLLGMINCPVLALNGTKDTQVDCKKNLGVLERGLPKSGKNKVQAMEGLNHLFQHCTTGLAAEYPQIEETFSPEALALIADWLKSLLPL